MESFDLIVIGGGPGGYVAAIRGAQLGLKVACVEREESLGGTCLRVGCIPSKALLESSALFEQASKTFGKHGIKISKPEVDLAAMMKRKDQVVRTLGRGVDSLFKKNQITRLLGTGRLAGKGKVAVTTADGETTYEAKHIILATGSRSASLPGIQEDGDRIGSSTEALTWPDVPGHLVVIGAGYIGLELGSVWRRLGAKVTVLEYLDRILPGMDSETAADARKIFQAQGLRFQLGAKVTRAAVEGNGCVVEAEGLEPIACDRVLVAVGRRPNSEDLGLETVGIQPDRRGSIPVDDQFRTSAEGVYAIGDLVAGPMLAHKAEEDGVACVECIAGQHGHVNYDTIPGVCYTEPEIGTVGKTEEQLKEAGIEYKKGIALFVGNGRAHAVNHAEGKVKVLADAQTDRILGVHIIGAHAGDLINEAATAMNFGASAEDMILSCHAHPTLGETLREACMAVHGRAIHG